VWVPDAIASVSPKSMCPSVGSYVNITPEDGVEVALRRLHNNLGPSDAKRSPWDLSRGGLFLCYPQKQMMRAGWF